MNSPLPRSSRPRVDWKFLAMTATAAAATGSLLYFGVKFQRGRIAERLRSDAAKLSDSPSVDLKQAQRAWIDYLYFRPSDQDAMIRLSQLMVKRARTLADKRNAAIVMERALMRDLGNRDLQRALARAEIELIELEPARLEKLSARLEVLVKEEPDDAELQDLLGRCHQTQGRTEAAISRFREAIRIEPQRVEAYIHLSDLLKTLKRDEEAAQTAEMLVQAVPDSPIAYLARWRHRKIETDLTKALELGPANVDVLIAAAEDARAAQRPDEARQRLTQALNASADDHRPYQALAELEKEAGHLDAAEAALTKGVELMPDLIGLKLDLIDIQIQRSKLTEAEGLIESERVRMPEPTRRFLEARLLSAQGKWDAAASRLERLRPLVIRDEAMSQLVDLMLCRCYQELSNLPARREALGRVLERDPSNKAARLGLAETAAAGGFDEDAVNMMIKLIPEVPEARLAAASLLIKSRRFREAENLVGPLARSPQAKPAEILILSRILANQGRVREAESLLIAARGRSPKTVDYGIGLADLAMARSDLATAARHLDQTQAQAGDSAALRAARARVIARDSNDPRRLERIKELAQGAEAFSDADRRDLLLSLAVFRLDAALEQGGDLVIAETVGDLRRAEGEDGVLWRHGEASRLVMAAGRGDPSALEQARSLADQIEIRKPNWTKTLLLRAQIAQFSADPNTAIASYRQAIESGENRQETVRLLAKTLYDQGRYSEVLPAIRSALGNIKVRGELGRLAAESARQLDQGNEAASLARDAVEGGASAPELVWLASMIEWNGELAEAEKTFIRAAALAPGELNSWNALIRFFSRQGKNDEAARVARQAQGYVPKEKAALASAMFQESMGKVDSADQAYQALADAQPNDLETLKIAADHAINTGHAYAAERYCRRIIDPGLKAPVSDLVWARRSLAVALIAQGKPQGLREAATLAERNLRTGLATIEDRKARALALTNDPTRLKEAIAAWEEIARIQKLQPNDRMTLGGLREAAGEWAKAKELYGEVAKTSPDPQRLRAFANSLLLRDELEEAKAIVAQLVKIDPKSLQTAIIRARLDAQSGQSANPEALLEPFRRGPAEDQREIASALEDLGRFDQAEASYRDWAKRGPSVKRPEAILDLAMFLGRRGRIREAAALCRDSWSNCEIEASAEAAADLIRLAEDKLAPEHVQLLSQGFESKQKELKSATALFHYARFQAAIGQTREAKTIYWRVLEMEPKHVEALNNLAWLFALAPDSLEDKTKAVELSAQAMVLAGRLPDLLDTHAVALLAVGKPDPAAAALNEALALQPSPTLHFHLARVHLSAGRKDQALEAIGKAQSLGFTVRMADPLEHQSCEEMAQALGVDLARLSR